MIAIFVLQEGCFCSSSRVDDAGSTTASHISVYPNLAYREIY